MGNNKNNMNVDLKEMQMQERDEILKTGKYVEISIVIPKDNDLDPAVSFECNSASPLEIAMAIDCMKKMEENLYKSNPMLNY